MTTEHTILPGLKYIHKNDHRDGNYNKSQWSISQNAERNVFSLAHKSNWFFDNIGWGLHFVNKSVNYLGVSVIRSRELFIGKFINGTVLTYGTVILQIICYIIMIDLIEGYLMNGVIQVTFLSERSGKS